MKKNDRKFTELGAASLMAAALLICFQGCSNPVAIEYTEESPLVEELKAGTWRYVDLTGKSVPGTLRFDLKSGIKNARTVRITGSFEEVDALNRAYVQFLFEMRHPGKGSKDATGFIQAPMRKGHEGPLTLPWTIFLPPDLPGRTLLSLMGVTWDGKFAVIHYGHTP